MKAYFHNLPETSDTPMRALEGKGIAEDKRYLNAKSPWTLAHLDMKLLQGFYNNPQVPPSMKTKLKTAMMIKPTLKSKSKTKLNKLLRGGLAGVSKASGFIQRLMAENKKKHEGRYMNPTWELHPESTMKRAEEFDWKKLASDGQGGLNRTGNPYGASPFITKHFRNRAVAEGKADKETEAQRKARRAWTNRMAEPIHEDLENHFGNIRTDLFSDDEPETVAVRATRSDPAPKPEAPKADDRVFTIKDIKQLPKDKAEADIQDRYRTMGKLHTMLMDIVFENRKIKLAGAIKILEEKGVKNKKGEALSSGYISPLLKDAKEDVETGIADTLKYEEFHTRSAPLKSVLEKFSKNRKSINEAKNILQALRWEKEEKDYQIRREEERKAEIKRREEERLERIEEAKRQKEEEKRLAEEAVALQEKEFKESRAIAKTKLKANLPPKAQMDKWKETWARYKGRELDRWEKNYWFGDVLRRWYGPGSFPGKDKTGTEKNIPESEYPKEPKLKYEVIPGEFYPGRDKVPKKRLTAKSQAESDAYNALIRKQNEEYTLSKNNIKEMAVEFVKWLFHKALPLYDYELLEDVEVDKFKRFLVLTSESGKFSMAWGLKDDEAIAEDMIEPVQAERTGFSFSKVYKIDHKDGEDDEWSKLSFDDIYAKNTPRGQPRQGLVLLGNNPPDDPIDWALPKGIAQIIRPLWEELMEYTEEEEAPKNEIVQLPEAPAPKNATTSEYPKDFSTRMKNIATILRANAGLSLAGIASKLNKDYKDRGANGDLTKSAINKAVNVVKDWLKKGGQTGSGKPQRGIDEYVMCGV